MLVFLGATTLGLSAPIATSEVKMAIVDPPTYQRFVVVCCAALDRTSAVAPHGDANPGPP